MVRSLADRTFQLRPGLLLELLLLLGLRVQLHFVGLEALEGLLLPDQLDFRQVEVAGHLATGELLLVELLLELGAQHLGLALGGLLYDLLILDLGCK